MNPSHHLRSNLGNDSHYELQSQVNVEDQAFTPQSKRHTKKGMTKKQEMSSKYQNSKNSIDQTQSPTLIKQGKVITAELSQPHIIPTVSNAGTNFSHHPLTHSQTQEMSASAQQTPQTFSDHVPYMNTSSA